MLSSQAASSLRMSLQFGTVSRNAVREGAKRAQQKIAAAAQLAGAGQVGSSSKGERTRPICHCRRSKSAARPCLLHTACAPSQRKAPAAAARTLLQPHAVGQRPACKRGAVTACQRAPTGRAACSTPPSDDMPCEPSDSTSSDLQRTPQWAGGVWKGQSGRIDTGRHRNRKGHGRGTHGPYSISDCADCTRSVTSGIPSCVPMLGGAQWAEAVSFRPKAV